MNTIPIARRIALPLLLLSSACDLINPYEPPAPPPIPAQFSEATAEETTAAAWPDQAWWTQFQSAELTAWMEEAKANNTDLAAAVARLRQADAQTTIAGASLLPVIDASGDASRAIAPNPATPRTRATGSNYQAGVSASYALDFWGKNRSSVDAAEALRDASAYDQQTVLLTVTSSVATVYFDMLATSERVRIAQENLATTEKLLATLNQRFKAGISSQLDVAQQETIVATQRAALAPLQLRLTQNRNALAILLGRMPESMPPSQQEFAAIALPDVPAGVPSQLLQRRPDVLKAEAELISAHADLNAARAAFFPSISLTGAANVASSALGDLFQSGGQLLSFSGSITQSIFSGGNLSGQLEVSHAREDELTQNYRKAVLNAFGDVEDALAAVHRAAEEESAQAVADKSARTALELSQKQFNAGLIDLTTLLNTQRSLLATSDAYMQSKLKRLQAIVGLYQALGGGWEGSHATL